MRRYTSREVKDILTKAFPEREPFCFAILNWYRKQGHVPQSFPGSNDYSESDLQRIAWLTELRLAGISISKINNHPEFLKKALDRFHNRVQMRLEKAQQEILKVY